MTNSWERARRTTRALWMGLLVLPTCAVAADAWALPAAAEVTPTGQDDADAARDDAIFGAPDTPPAAPAPASGAAGGAASEQDREADMFGGEAPSTPAGPAGGARAATSPVGRAGDDYGDPRMQGRVVERRDLLDEDRLQIGGLFYMQNGFFLTADTPWHQQSFTHVNLTDMYIDVRANDRVRAFVRGRMLYSPVAGDATSAAFLGMSGRDGAVSMALDQLWLKFDVERLVYLTVGAQHLRWGATRLWNPVDVIYATRRNPLTLFDQRTGLPMFKVHVPFEVKGNAWNAYAIALADDASDLAHFGVAARLEAVISTWEIGLTAMRRRQVDPRFGLDVSAGLWVLDVTGELGLRVADSGVTWMASGGLSYTLDYGDEDSLILGVEYFHNPGGYPTAAKAARGMADITISQALYGDRSPRAGENAFDFFYMGQQYAALFAVAMGPGSWDDTSFTLSLLSNLSDRTGLLRFDVGTSVLTDLRLEVYASAFVGSDGEFRFYGDSLGDAMKEAGLAAIADLKTADLTEEAKALMSDPKAAASLGSQAAFPAPQAQFGLNLRLSL